MIRSWVPWWVLIVVLAGTLTLAGDPVSAREMLRCESWNNQYQHCRMKTKYGVVLVYTLSSRKSRCIRGQTWGWDRYGVWVKRGCRAVFVQGNWVNRFAHRPGHDGDSRDGGLLDDYYRRRW